MIVEPMRKASRASFHGLGRIVLTLVVLSLLLPAFIYWRLSKGPIEIPQIANIIESQITQQFENVGMSIGKASLEKRDGQATLDIVLNHVSVQTLDGENLLLIPSITTGFSLKDIFAGNISPTELDVSGASIGLRREEEGRFTIFGAGQGSWQTSSLDEVTNIFENTPALQNVKKVTLQNIDIVISDLQADQLRTFEDTALSLTREDDVFEFNARLQLAKGTDQSLALATVRHVLGEKESSFNLQFADLLPSTLVASFPTLQFLKSVQAPASGSFNLQLEEGSPVGDLEGVLEFGSGVLKAETADREVKFNSAKSYFSYAKDRDEITVHSVALDSDFGRLEGVGKIEVQRGPDQTVSSIKPTLRFETVVVSAQDFFENDLMFEEAYLSATLTPDPLKFDVHDFIIWDQETHYEFKGTSIPENGRWHSAYDVRIDLLSSKRLKELWPLIAIQKTRRWVDESVDAGQIADFKGDITYSNGEAKFAFNFALQDVESRLIKTVPYLKDGRGTGTLTHNNLTLRLDQGHVVAKGETVDLAGSSLFIPDIKSRPANGEIEFRANGNIQSALSLLNSEKFKFLDKMGLPVTIANGVADVTGQFKLPLAKKVNPEQISFTVNAGISNLSSEGLIKDRALRSRKLDLSATKKGLSLTGPITLDGIPAEIEWKMGFNADESAGTTLSADLTLTPRLLDQWGVTFEKGFFSGSAPATLLVALEKGTQPSFKLTSTLQGAELSLSQIGWKKSKNQSVKFELSGLLGDTPSIDSFILRGKGLETVGALDLTKDGGLGTLRLTSLKVGNWIDTSATIEPRKNQATKITLNGGRLDIRKLPQGTERSAGKGTELVLVLDRVQITQGISLSNFRSQLSTKSGLSGEFTANVNGGARVSGIINQQEDGTQIELNSKNAGRVLRDAKLISTVYNGELVFFLKPVQANGARDGVFKISSPRVKQSNVLANLLNAASGVGLVQQLNGEGIHFTTVRGGVRLTPQGVQLREVSAVGPSLGLSLNGWYYSENKNVAFQGVVTPLYAVNGVFERVFGKIAGRQRGEGLFGFSYKMSGPAEKPKVSVNPMSILTPGVFREIFRQPIPKPTQ